MDMFIILSVVTLPEVCTYTKPYHLYTFHVCSIFYVSFISIKILKIPFTIMKIRNNFNV